MNTNMSQKKRMFLEKKKTLETSVGWYEHFAR